ncbi:MAG TPA: helix-turn-helix domain-containing protein [Candidatus Nanopelagicaceae bacterium]|nr:helix-turn-helix domain-containing protein [Candidatus Nanopelagicaceae bacterium]
MYGIGTHLVRLAYSLQLLVELSTADTNKWRTLLDRKSWGPRTSEIASQSGQNGLEAHVIRQRQRRITNVQTERLVAPYGEGATVYQLAEEFDIDRHTVSERVKRAGLTMRYQPPSDGVINEMIQLYLSGLSLVAVGSRIGISPGTVRRYVKEYGVQMRDTPALELQQTRTRGITRNWIRYP